MVPRILELKNPAGLLKEFQRIGVDGGGVAIMASKAFLRVIKVGPLPNFCANILKQEMLSLGADAALSRGAITGHDKKTPCLLIGTLSQYEQLIFKLRKQPFGLARLSEDLRTCLSRDRTPSLYVGNKRMRLDRRTMVMGIMNATPDSFSGDGIFGMSLPKALAMARNMVRDGADILDIGGESTRPGSRRVSLKEEMGRVIPLVRLLVKSVRVPLSIDTTKSDVARAALDCGVRIINDISALRGDRRMAKVAARYRATIVLMHMKGTPRTMQTAPYYDDLMGEISCFLADALKKALDSGISEDRIIVDPGIGFGKTRAHNLEIIRRLPELKSLGCPILVGVSRKRFIGEILGADVNDRQWGTAAAVSAAISGGAHIVRVHDVRILRDVVRVTDAIRAS